MEFIGKRSHKKSRKRMGVREVDRSDHQEPRELTALRWVEEAFFAGATLPQLCLPVGMQQLCSFKYRWLASKDFKVVKFHRDFKFKS